MKKKGISSYIYIALFIILIGVLGVLSAKNLLSYYVNDEVKNNEWTPDLGDEKETTIAANFFAKDLFVGVNATARNLLGQREMNDVIKLNNGYLIRPFGLVKDDVLKPYVDNLEKFDKYLKNRGTDMVYALAPSTVSKYDPQLPKGYEYYGNDDGDRLLRMLEKAGVETIDFRERMHKDNIDQYDMMYKTDHHWNSKAGLYAYNVLKDYIVEKIGCTVDEKIGDSSSYDITTYKDYHLGTNGRRTGIEFAGVDDFDLYIPKFESKLEDSEGRVGSMVELMYDLESLKEVDYENEYVYDTVFKRVLGNYKNLDCPNDKKLLVITDSFGRVVNQYLAMGFSEIRFVHDSDVSGVTPEYIEEYDPDVVILLYYLGSAVNEGGYRFSAFE